MLASLSSSIPALCARLGLASSLGLALVVAPSVAAAGSAPTAACRTDWEMHPGEGIVEWGYDIGQHGAIAEYDSSTIPDPWGPGWGPSPNPVSIEYDLGGNSTLCAQGTQCRHGAEFTYFRTLVYLPPNLAFSEAWVDVQVVDDGVRMTVFSDSQPAGVTDPGGYAFLGGGVSTDLLPYMANDPWTWIVLTHADDCCSQAYIRGVEFYVFVNGRPEPVSTNCDLDDNDGDGFPPAGGDCDDDDAAIHPGAPEVEDGIDNDCDGVTDEGTDAFDDDGDGFTELDGDCNDELAVFNPGADEHCDQHDLDYDCDGCPGSTDPDCGGTCGEPGDDDDTADDDDDDDADDDDDDDDAAGDDDDADGAAGDNDDAAGDGPGSEAPAGCTCLDQQIEAQPGQGAMGLLLLVGLAGLRRRLR